MRLRIFFKYLILLNFFVTGAAQSQAPQAYPQRNIRVIIPGAPHTFHLQPKQRDLRPLVTAFFDQHLKAKPGK